MQLIYLQWAVSFDLLECAKNITTKQMEWFGMSSHICSSLVSSDPTAGIHCPLLKASEASKPVRYCQSHRAGETKLEERV